jgi:hypothetical protein
MAENAWLNFRCETDKKTRIATFRHVGGEWRLTEVGADTLPEEATIPGRVAMTGSFGIDPGYAGCPGCEADKYVLCHCGTLACWRSANTHHTCPSCGNRGKVEGAISSLDAMEIA